MSQIYSVTQLNTQVKTYIESNFIFRNLFVQGEISNYKKHTSGHHYFTLKDEESAIPVVLFRNDAMRLRFSLQNGLQVIVRGRIDTFPKTGQVQLYAADLMPDGMGAFHLAFEQQKQKLYKEGLFSPAHKKPLPTIPSTIALVTAPTGAAVWDMIRILRNRFPLAQVRVWGTLVQGPQAAQEIAQTIRNVNRHGEADVMIVGRGGGSIEDLWAFNEEIVARAIYESQIPIVSAVGHEPDVLISDFVADVRAPTPSGAAELVVPELAALSRKFLEMEKKLSTEWFRYSEEVFSKLQNLSVRLENKTPEHYLKARSTYFATLYTRMCTAYRNQLQLQTKQLEYLQHRFFAAQKRYCNIQHTKYQYLVGKLESLSPLHVLSRGFIMAYDEKGKLLSRVSKLDVGQNLSLHFADGFAQVQIQSIISEETASCQKK